MKKVVLFFIVAFIVASCTITEKVVFNEKTGGDISYELDASSFASIMASMDTTGKPFNITDSLAELSLLTASLKTVKGVNNVNLKTEENKLTLSFSFDNAEALNNAHIALGSESPAIKSNKSYQKLTVKNKKEWVYRTFPLGESAQDSTYSTMGMMLTYKLDATFPKSVKSVDSKDVTFSGNTISWSSTQSDLGGKYAFDGIKVKLK